MSELLYGLIVEDRWLEKALREIIPRIITPCKTEIRARNGKPDLIANFYKPLLELRFNFPTMHKAIVVCDADQDDAGLLEQKLQKKFSENRKLAVLGFPIKFHVIKTELETWLLADPQALSQATGKNIQVPMGGNLETAQNTKETLVKALQKHKTAYTPSLAAAIAQTLPLETLRARCPGFRDFELKVQNGKLK